MALSGTGLALKRDAEIAGAWLGRGGGWSRVTPSWPSADSAAPKPDAGTERKRQPQRAHLVTERSCHGAGILTEHSGPERAGSPQSVVGPLAHPSQAARFPR
jgi:hypothetical protein